MWGTVGVLLTVIKVCIGIRDEERERERKGEGRGEKAYLIWSTSVMVGVMDVE